MASASCPQCGASGIEYCAGHKVKVKGGWDKDYRQDVCFKCGYASEKYIPFSTPIMVKVPPRPEKYQEKQQTKQAIENTNEKRITFHANVGDAEINITVGKDGLSKLLSMFMEG